MTMNKETNPQEMVAFDFSNLNLQENSRGNCFGSCDCDCNCDCDSDDCDCNNYCDNCD